MSTLISIRTAQGEVSVCNAKCYEAKHPRCLCICGGKNHGVGIEQAKQNVLQHQKEMVDAFVLMNHIHDYEVMINITVVNQMTFPNFLTPLTDRLRRKRMEVEEEEKFLKDMDSHFTS